MERIDELKRRLDRIRPLTAEHLHLLWPRFEAEKPNFVYATNAIEGNSLTLGETTVILHDGITIAGKPLKDHLDALNSAKAFDLMLAIAADETYTRPGRIDGTVVTEPRRPPASATFCCRNSKGRERVHHALRPRSLPPPQHRGVVFVLCRRTVRPVPPRPRPRPVVAENPAKARAIFDRRLPRGTSRRRLGSITRKRGLWYAILTADYDGDGRQLRHWSKGHKTRRQAERTLAQLLVERRQAKATPHTVKDVVTAYVEHDITPRGRRSPTTT